MPAPGSRFSLVTVLLALLSGLLLDLPFPIAGPMPLWRAAFGWVALAPLLYALLAPASASSPLYLRRSALVAYLCGVLWYILNCYWIYDTMKLYAGVSAPGAAGILLLYSLVLGLYFGLFGWAIAFLRRTSKGIFVPLLLAPFLWTAIDLAASRITSVPWDQLGYSQVDNLLLTRLAPFTGVYGITFVLVAVNALFAAALLAPSIHPRVRIAVGAALLAVLLQLGSWTHPAPAPTLAIAVLLQDNLSVKENNDWTGPIWDTNIARFDHQSVQTNGPWYSGLPGKSKLLHTQADLPPQPISLIAWPEAPSAFRGWDPRFQHAMTNLATTASAAVVAGNISAGYGVDAAGHPTISEYNSASFVSPDGRFLGKYDKIHLVPFGEYIPYRDIFFFAHHLTQQVSDFARGEQRTVFAANGRRYGVFICYEAVFADEIRHFARNGAEVLVNISDDGWYGDTSAPWQHLNMARMRAVENRRWLLRDTNTGVTASIDPYGRVIRSAPRHVFTSLAVAYGFRSDLTFYTRFGDLFACLCGIISLGALAYFTLRTHRSHL
jgi:apolipoprotein N-acyltransferase